MNTDPGLADGWVNDPQEFREYTFDQDLVTAARTWRRQELARIMARLTTRDQAAVTAALSLLIEAAGAE